MSFLSAAALLVALFVVAPVAAHLLRRRSAEERPFPPARLVPRTQPTARRRSMLEDRALFFVRALAVLGLALLGAAPFIRCSRLALSRREGASAALAIVIDDSLSMRATAGYGAPGAAQKSATTRFDRALAAARELTEGLDRGDAVAIVLAGAPARIALGSTTNMGAATATLSALEPSDRATDLDGAVQLARGLLRGLAQRDKRIVLLSDLADGAHDAPPLAGDDQVTLWAPLPELEARGQDCAVTRADRAGAKVWARVVCSRPAGAVDAAADRADADADEPPPSGSADRTLAAPEEPAYPGASAARAVELRAGGKVLAKVPLGPSVRAEEVALDLPTEAARGATPGAPSPDPSPISSTLYVGLTGADAITADDEAPVIAAGGALPTAIVVDAATSRVATGGPPPIEQAFAALALDADVHPLPAVPEHEAELDAYAALIVDDAPGFTPEVRRAITAWVERGGALFLTLGPRAAAAPLGAGFEPLVPGVVRWTRWETGKADGIDPTSAPSLGPSAAGLASLGPRGRATLTPAAVEGAELLARWKDGAPFLIRRALGRGAVLTLTLPLSADESDLVLRPAFLALLDRFVSTARARGGARRIDVGEAWTFDGYDDVRVRYATRDGAREPRPIPVTLTDGRPRAEAPLAGLYALTLDGAATTRVAAVPEREVDLRPRRVRDDARATSLGGVTSSLDASPYVALALLALFAVELVLRLVGQRPPTSPERPAPEG
jgi:von Willebrand factor type A domain/Aerotolerance regulator N-terminal